LIDCLNLEQVISFIDAFRKGFFIFLIRVVQHAPLNSLMLVVYTIPAPITTAMVKMWQTYDKLGSVG